MYLSYLGVALDIARIYSTTLVLKYTNMMDNVPPSFVEITKVVRIFWEYKCTLKVWDNLIRYGERN